MPVTKILETENRSNLFRKISNQIWNGLDLKVILQTAVDEIGELLNLDRCGFLWYFPESQRVQVVCQYQNHSRHSSQLGYYPLSALSLNGTAIAKGKSIVNYRPESSPAFGTIVRLITRLRHSPIAAPTDNQGTTVANLLVPVKGQGGWLGLISCGSELARGWSETDIEFIQAVAQQLEIAIRQTKLYEQTQRQAQKEKLIAQIVSQTRQSFDLETILTQAIAKLLEALAADRCLVHLVEDLGDIPEKITKCSQHLYEVCRPPFLPSIDNFNLQGPITQWVIQHRQPVVIANVTQDSRIGANNLEYQQAQIKSSLVVPVQSDGKLHALIYINQCAKVRYWSKSDQELAQAVADQLAISLQQASLYAQTRRQMEGEALLRMISNRLHSTLNVTAILQIAASKARQFLNADRVVVYQFQPDQTGQVAVEDLGEGWEAIAGQTIPSNDLLQEYAFLSEQGQIKAVSDISDSDFSPCYLNFLQQLQVKAILVVPILQQNSTRLDWPSIADFSELCTNQNCYLWGLLIVHQCTDVRVWKADEINLLQQLANQIAIAIQQAELYHRARSIAEAAQIKAQELEQASAELQAANQKLQTEILERQQAERLLHQKNSFVRLIKEVAIAANEAPSSEIALENCLTLICQHTNWPVGHVYLTDANQKLIPTPIWHLQEPERFSIFRKVTETIKFSPGRGLPGRVLMSGKPIWIVDVSQDINFIRARYALDMGVRAAFAFPVLVGAEVVAVMEFFSTQAIEPDEVLLDVVANIGTQLGRVIERERASAATNASEAKAKEQAWQLQQTVNQLQQAQSQLIQTEKMSSLGQMVAGIAHEINNPVNFIYGNLIYTSQYSQNLLSLVELYQKHYPYSQPEIEAFIEEIELNYLIEDLPKTISSMESGAERIQQLVLSLRNFARLDESAVKRVDIHEGLDSTLLIIQNRLHFKEGYSHIQVIKEYGKLPLVECYAGQLNQVFMNILNNAIDALVEDSRYQQVDYGNNSYLAGEHRFPKPIIKIKTEMAIANHITVRISDNGPGINEEVKARLFDPFFTTKPVGQGTGLGLSICYQIIVEKHGGAIGCNSKPGEGAEFWMEIPIQKKSPSAISPLPEVKNQKSEWSSPSKT